MQQQSSRQHQTSQIILFEVSKDFLMVVCERADEAGWIQCCGNDDEDGAHPREGLQFVVYFGTLIAGLQLWKHVETTDLRLKDLKGASTQENA